MLWLHMRVSICKKLFVDVVVLCSGNKKLTKNNKDAAFHSHRAAAFLSVVFFLLAVSIVTPPFRSLCFPHWPRSPCNTTILSEQVIGFGMGSWFDL